MWFTKKLCNYMVQFDYSIIVQQYYEGLKPLFINYIRKNFDLSYDDIMDIYADVWIDVRNNILNGRVEKETKWQAYILKMGWNQANKLKNRLKQMDSIDVEGFNSDAFEKEYTENAEAEKSIYSDPQLIAILGAELSYIPDPCNKILKLYYHDGMSMTEIADSMNYSNQNSAKTTKNRCMDKLKARILNTVRNLGILD